MKNPLAVFLFYLSFIPITFAQLQKGDKTIGFSGDMFLQENVSNTNYSQNGMNAHPFLGVMVTDQLMAEMSIGLLSRNSFREQSNITGTSIYSFRPAFRYYFKPYKKILPFVRVGSTIMHRIYETASINEEWGGWFAKGYGALGMNYFLAPNIAIDARIGTKLFDTENHIVDELNPENIYLRIGVQTFLNNRFETTQVIHENYLRQGNYRLSGNAGFSNVNANRISSYSYGSSSTDGSGKGFTTYLRPSFEYFKTDRWTIGGGLDLSILNTKAGYQLKTGVSAKSGYYIPIANGLYIKPELELQYNRTQVNAKDFQFVWDTLSTEPIMIVSTFDTVDVKNKVHRFDIPAAISLVYFTQNNMILSGGYKIQPRFDFSDLYEDRTALEQELYLGLEYFFAPNVSLSSKLGYILERDDQEAPGVAYDLEPDSKSVRLSFSLNYLIFDRG